MIGSQRFVPIFDPDEATLLRSAVLEPIFGLPRTDQEKLIDSIPQLVGSHRLLAELYMFPSLNLLSLNRAHFDDSNPPDFLISGRNEFVPPARWTGELWATDWPQWPTARWTTVLRFHFEGELVVVATPRIIAH